MTGKQYTEQLFIALHERAQRLGRDIMTACKKQVTGGLQPLYGDGPPIEIAQIREVADAQESTLAMCEGKMIELERVGVATDTLCRNVAAITDRSRKCLNKITEGLPIIRATLHQAKTKQNRLKETLAKREEEEDRKRNRPTEPGHYWWREGEGHNWGIKNVVCREGDKLYVVKHEAIRVLCALPLGGQWGPKIEEPTN